jgi:hypothetical protein
MVELVKARQFEIVFLDRKVGASSIFHTGQV